MLFNVLDAISSLTMSCRQGQDAVAAAGAALGPLAATTPATVPVTGATSEAGLPTKDAEPHAGDSSGGGSGNSVLALLASMLGSRHTVLTSKVRRCIHLKCETGMPQLQLLLTLCLVRLPPALPQACCCINNLVLDHPQLHLILTLCLA